MTKAEAIKYLQQLYPNGGHCWLDEQRIEAIGIAVKALQEEPVSKDLEKAARDILDTYKPIFSSSTSDGEPIEYYSPGQMRTMFMKGSYWQKELQVFQELQFQTI